MWGKPKVHFILRVGGPLHVLNMSKTNIFQSILIFEGILRTISFFFDFAMGF